MRGETFIQGKSWLPQLLQEVTASSLAALAALRWAARLKRQERVLENISAIWELWLSCSCVIGAKMKG